MVCYFSPSLNVFNGPKSGVCIVMNKAVSLSIPPIYYMRLKSTLLKQLMYVKTKHSVVSLNLIITTTKSKTLMQFLFCRPHLMTLKPVFASTILK